MREPTIIERISGSLATDVEINRIIERIDRKLTISPTAHAQRYAKQRIKKWKQY